MACIKVGNHDVHIEDDVYTDILAKGGRLRVTSLGRVMIEFCLGPYTLGVQAGKCVDHTDRNPLNNIKSNLRYATVAENNANKAKTKRPTSSKYKGVHYNKRNRKWQACFCDKYLGLFANEEDAARAYDKEAIARFGEFACLNLDC